MYSTDKVLVTIKCLQSAPLTNHCHLEMSVNVTCIIVHSLITHHHSMHIDSCEGQARSSVVLLIMVLLLLGIGWCKPAQCDKTSSTVSASSTV